LTYKDSGYKLHTIAAIVCISDSREGKRRERRRDSDATPVEAFVPLRSEVFDA